MREDGALQLQESGRQGGVVTGERPAESQGIHTEDKGTYCRVVGVLT